MLDLEKIKSEINILKKDVSKNYDKLLNIYMKLMIELKFMERTDEDL